ncbi:MAG TPA: hypothetical protein VKZ68_09490 [Ohtaekwangia sp.]|nr:hypothetical protein [Ohtaekwangia sp.]
MKSIWKWIIAVVAGGASGFLCWFFVGCNNGCAITSSPVNSTLYGAIMATLLFNGVGTASARKNQSDVK